jgi:succinate-semialdehyde dehydrogenase/glutarate-semialdehyde dehydrogenase
MSAFRSLDPASEEIFARFEEHDDAELERRLEGAEGGFARWRKTPFAERAALLRAAAGLLRAERDEHARDMAREMGKPLAQAEAEIEKCAVGCEFYAEHAEALLAPEPIESDADRSGLRFEPLGPVLAVMPWNFPYWQVFRFAAPALMAGNVALLKHAENVPGCARAIEDVWRRAGCPEGVFQNLFVARERVGGVIDHPAVRAVTLTGSERAGAAVAARAGAQLKKTVLELGGSDPFVVLDDVDVAAVARQAAWARTQNSGQSCIAAKRFVVMEGVADAFVEAFRAELAALRVGPPQDRSVDVGPLARADLREHLENQVERSLAAGARLLLGGKRPEGVGFFYPPTLLDRVGPDSAAGSEELFGPVAAVQRARSEAEAVELANHTSFGLGASLWSADAARAEALIPHIEAGAVFVNGVVKSDPRLPFGGIRRSGYGRELGVLGLREFVNAKTTWLREAP